MKYQRATAIEELDFDIWIKNIVQIINWAPNSELGARFRLDFFARLSYLTVSVAKLVEVLDLLTSWNLIEGIVMDGTAYYRVTDVSMWQVPTST